MKKDHTVGKSQGKKRRLTIGLDLGDRSSRYCILDEQGDVLSEGSAATTKKGLAQAFGSKPRSRIALEVGTHSPWVSRYLADLGHEVIVANARRVRLITDSSRKNDRLDAKTLARLARIDPELLSPIRHRSEQAQADLMVIRARAALVEARTMLVNSARGLTKSYGERLPSCGTGQVREELAGQLSAPLQKALGPLLAEVESLSERIRECHEGIERRAQESYPQVAQLKQVKGVGTLIALTFLLTLEDAHRFRQMLADNKPVIAPMDQDAWARNLGYMESRAPESVALYGLNRHHNLQLLRRLKPGDLEKSAYHPELKHDVTVAEYIEKMGTHGENHLAQIERLKKQAQHT